MKYKILKYGGKTKLKDVETGKSVEIDIEKLMKESVKKVPKYMLGNTPGEDEIDYTVDPDTGKYLHSKGNKESGTTDPVTGKPAHSQNNTFLSNLGKALGFKKSNLFGEKPNLFGGDVKTKNFNYDFDSELKKQLGPNEDPYVLGEAANSFLKNTEKQFQETKEKGDKFINSVNKQEDESFQFFNPHVGRSLEQDLFSLGQGLENKDGFNIATSGLSFLTGAGRSFLGGKGTARRNNYVGKNAWNKQNRITPNHLTDEGTVTGRYGGSLSSMETRREFDDLNRRGVSRLKYGGKLDEELATGEYMRGQDEAGVNREDYNAEVERGEYFKSSEGDVAEVVGNKHEKSNTKTSGEKIQMNEEDRVLSDTSTVGVRNAKKLSLKYDLKIDSKDTYSAVLDKLRKKLKLDKIIKEEAAVLKKMSEQKKVKDVATRDLNLEFLAEKAEDIKKKKAPLLELRSVVFDELYEMQESSKKGKKKHKGQEILEEAQAFKYGGSLKEVPRYELGTSDPKRKKIKINEKSPKIQNLIKKKGMTKEDLGWIERIISFEQEHGSSAGTGLSNKVWSKGKANSNEDAVDFIWNKYGNLYKDFPLDKRIQLADFHLNSEDPRAALLVASGKLSPKEKQGLYLNRDNKDDLKELKENLIARDSKYSKKKVSDITDKELLDYIDNGNGVSLKGLSKRKLDSSLKKYDFKNTILPTFQDPDNEAYQGSWDKYNEERVRSYSNSGNKEALKKSWLQRVAMTTNEGLGYNSDLNAYKDVIQTDGAGAYHFSKKGDKKVDWRKGVSDNISKAFDDPNFKRSLLTEDQSSHIMALKDKYKGKRLSEEDRAKWDAYVSRVEQKFSQDNSFQNDPRHSKYDALASSNRRHGGYSEEELKNAYNHYQYVGETKGQTFEQFSDTVKSRGMYIPQFITEGASLTPGHQPVSSSGAGYGGATDEEKYMSGVMYLYKRMTGKDLDLNDTPEVTKAQQRYREEAKSVQGFDYLFSSKGATDGKFGNRTASAGLFQEHMKAKHKGSIDVSKYLSLSDEEQADVLEFYGADKEEFDKILEHYTTDEIVFDVDESLGAQPEITIEEEEKVQEEDKSEYFNYDFDSNLKKKLGPKLGWLSLPDDTPLSPLAERGTMLPNRQFERMRALELDIEPLLQRIDDRRASEVAGLEGYNPQIQAILRDSANQRAAEQEGNAYFQKKGADLTNFQNVANQNVGIANMEMNAEVDDRLKHEQRQYLAEAKTFDDLNNFYNKLQENNAQKFETVHKLNLRNMKEDVYFDGQTYRRRPGSSNKDLARSAGASGTA